MGKILIVDDSEVVRIQVSGILSGAGYNVVEAEDGPEGLKKAQEDKDINIIICDYNMPDMNGIEMIEAVKKLDHHKTTFCGILTTESSSVLKEKGKAIGISLWIVKPVVAKNLLRVMGMIMQRMKQAS